MASLKSAALRKTAAIRMQPSDGLESAALIEQEQPGSEDRDCSVSPQRLRAIGSCFRARLIGSSTRRAPCAGAGAGGSWSEQSELASSLIVAGVLVAAVAAGDKGGA